MKPNEFITFYNTLPAVGIDRFLYNGLFYVAEQIVNLYEDMRDGSESLIKKSTFQSNDLVYTHMNAERIGVKGKDIPSELPMTLMSNVLELATLQQERLIKFRTLERVFDYMWRDFHQNGALSSHMQTVREHLQKKNS